MRIICDSSTSWKWTLCITSNVSHSCVSPILFSSWTILVVHNRIAQIFLKILVECTNSEILKLSHFFQLLPECHLIMFNYVCHDFLKYYTKISSFLAFLGSPSSFKPGTHQPQAGIHLISLNYFGAGICTYACVSVLRILITSGVMRLI